MKDSDREDILETVKAILADPNDYTPIAKLSCNSCPFAHDVCDAFRDALRAKIAEDEFNSLNTWLANQSISTWEDLARFIWRYQMTLAEDLADELDDVEGRVDPLENRVRRTEDAMREMENAIIEVRAMQQLRSETYRAPIDQPG
jgi:hypothetical protein